MQDPALVDYAMVVVVLDGGRLTMRLFVANAGK
jgi:hypothetical protein